MNATTQSQPTTTMKTATTTKTKKQDKSHQISRSKEARKARRIVRQSLRYGIMSDAADLEQDERDYYAAWITENAELIDESLAYLASIRRQPTAKTEKKSGKTSAKPATEKKPGTLTEQPKPKKAPKLIVTAAA